MTVAVYMFTKYGVTNRFMYMYFLAKIIKLDCVDDIHHENTQAYYLRKPERNGHILSSCMEQLLNVHL